MSLPDLGTTSNVPLPGHDITIKEMYNIAMRNNTAWGIEGYSVPRHYHDGRKKADKQPAPRALKKTDYLTDHLRATKSVPAPNHYEIVKAWVDEKNKPSKKHATKKNTYIDNIIRDQTLKPTPGPGAHNVRETEEQMKKRLGGHKGGKGSERTNFLCEMEYLSQTIPGPGNYNPRQIQPKIKEERMKPEDWKKKHGELSKKNKKSSFPDVGTFNPHPVSFRTFAKDMELRKENKDQKNVKIWGTASRFPSKKDAKKDPNNFPGPGSYPLLASWNGKTIEKKPKDKNWMNRLTKGIETSIYYS